MTPFLPLEDAGVPAYDDGWVSAQGDRLPFLSYIDHVNVNWSDDLESLHVESSRTHFLDVWGRKSMVSAIGLLPGSSVVVDIGCSSGYLLADLHESQSHALLIGIDLVASGLRRAHALVPSARLLQADVCALPLADRSVDVVVSANMLEHIRDDSKALEEIRRILVPGGRAVVMVPAGPGLYDYYDRFLGHVRRYGRRELTRKARDVGLDVIRDCYLGSFIYPAFWLVKQRNRLCHRDLSGDALEDRVASDIRRTAGSRLGTRLMRLEARAGVRLPFGVRELAVLQRGGSDA